MTYESYEEQFQKDPLSNQMPRAHVVFLAHRIFHHKIRPTPGGGVEQQEQECNGIFEAENYM